MDPQKWLFDKRIIRRNLKKGLITAKELNKQLKNLKDLEGEYENIILDNDEEQDENDEENNKDEDSTEHEEISDSDETLKTDDNVESQKNEEKF